MKRLHSSGRSESRRHRIDPPVEARRLFAPGLPRTIRPVANSTAPLESATAFAGVDRFFCSQIESNDVVLPASCSDRTQEKPAFLT
ncbi:MAG: hypothetical protein C3F11_02855 [Methylocystaceae bacterium]|nr:MAG: hypothetical protein C3F11_02855 [Methylocystaceae bacterium]